MKRTVSQWEQTKPDIDTLNLRNKLKKQGAFLKEGLPGRERVPA